MFKKKPRRILLISLVLLFSLTGCLPKADEQVGTLEISEPSIVAPSVQVAEKYYRGLNPYVASETRGMLYSNLNGFRLDADHLELGLMEIAQRYFSIDSHLFREGQVLKSSEINQWLKVESETNPSGLNEADMPTNILVHVLEHNYWNTKGDSLEGIVLGLSLASTYERAPVGDGEEEKVTMRFTPDELRNHGLKMADKIAERVRSKVGNVPIIICLYQLEESNSLVPGNFLSVGYVEKDQPQVSKWETINETYLLFPSNALARFDRDRSTSFARDFINYREAAQEFFPNYVGIIGVGRFIDEQMVELTLTVTTEFASKTEVIQLTQFLGATALDTFPKQIQLNIYVQAINQPQAVFVRPAGQEATMHIYR